MGKCVIHGIDQLCIRRTPLSVLGTSGGPSWEQALVSPRMPLNKFPRPYAIPKSWVLVLFFDDTHTAEQIYDFKTIKNIGQKRQTII